MKKRILRTISLVCVIALAMVSLSACSVVPTLSTTDEQTELIAEYAAGLLLKYNKGHALGLVPMYPEDFEDEPTEVPAEIVSEEEEIEDAEIITTEPEGEPLNEITEVEETVTSSASMAEAFGIPEFEVVYNGIECAEVYPEETGDDMIFSMQASNDKVLMVLHFNLVNPGEAPLTCSLNTSEVKARISIDGGKRIPALTTILINDLLTYEGEIAGYGMDDTVVVFEVDKEVAATMQSVSLIVVNDSGEYTYEL